ncbi:putative K(+)-stimulated pyrophosphate-energized sodium pump [Crenothrix polyspora]|uniref:Putative K(+)-stimulated pyrophosphate-energized sodium pump n=1 Tax=Crenothrix polyspora TaxID=360316 RepID=A0A1R4HA42_9GAMM|nr:OmpA family protein [Crenothrix polyspora]SJM93083.1 putative K(+)-stimulated pyrophosphate-energized sodium pump [Crenothrix polyspora]
MSKNLLELLNAHLTEDVVSKIAHFIGESNKNTGSALGSALPSLLSGLIHKGSDSQGAGILYNLLTQNYDSSLLSNLGAELMGGDVTAKLASAGGGFLNSIFGNKTDGIANVVVNASGISKQSSTSLLGLLTPIVFAVLGKTIKSEQITSPAGLMTLLGEQSGFLKNLLPAGLAGIFGVGAATASAVQSAPAASIHAVDEAITHKIETPVTSLAKDTEVHEPYIAPVLRERKIVPPPPPVEDDDAGLFGKMLPWLILGSILALGWGIWKNLKKSVDTAPPVAISGPDTTSTSTPAVTSTDTAIAPATPPASVTSQPVVAPAADNATSSFTQKLSTGFDLKAPANSMESKMYAFINDANAKIDKDKWFTMDGTTFDTGKATLKVESSAQITNITEILKAFPKVKIKIGGYTDNTGNAKSNHKLSADRANTIQSTLVKAGIDKSRLDAEGYGSNHPVATNATAEGRQQNRRIDLRITAK